MFCQRYLGEGEIDLVEYRTYPDANGRTINATIMDRGDERVIEGHGSGPLDAFVDADWATMGEDKKVHLHKLNLERIVPRLRPHLARRTT